MSSVKRVLIVPGIGGSSAEHWQTIWEKKHSHFKRVEQENWNFPKRTPWLRSLDVVIRSEPSPVVLVAHSLGCVLSAHWLADNPGQQQVVAALLVAPPELGRCGVSLSSFEPLPVDLPCRRLMLVASRSDPYATFAHAAWLARRWAAELVDAGDVGHINVASGHGAWAAGEALLAALLKNGDVSRSA